MSIRGYLSEEMSFEYIDNSSVNYNPILDICSMCCLIFSFIHLCVLVKGSAPPEDPNSFFVSKFIYLSSSMCGQGAPADPDLFFDICCELTLLDC